MSSFSKGRRNAVQREDDEAKNQRLLEQRLADALSAINRQTDGLLIGEKVDKPSQSYGRYINVKLKKSGTDFAQIHVYDDKFPVFTSSGGHTAQPDEQSIEGMLEALGDLYEKQYK